MTTSTYKRYPVIGFYTKLRSMFKPPWRNGSGSDSGSEGCVF